MRRLLDRILTGVLYGVMAVCYGAWGIFVMACLIKAVETLQPDRGPARWWLIQNMGGKR